MAGLSDLTWQQLADKLPSGTISIVNGAVSINVGHVIDATIDALDDTGVVKFFSVLFTAANKAQTEANAEQADGEKLAAFSPATIGSNVDGYITLSRPFICRSELATATNIIGTNG